MPVKPFSANTKKVIEQARDIAMQADQSFTTAHLLLAFFVMPNSAERLLIDYGINEETLLARFDATESERNGLSTIAESRAIVFAESTGSEAVFCLHLLAALTELPDGIAYRLLSRTGLAVADLREIALDYARQGAPEHWLKGTQNRVDRESVTAAFAALDDDRNQTRDTDVHLPELGEVTVQSPVVSRHASTERSYSKRTIDATRPENRRSPSAGRRSSDKTDGSGRRLDRQDLDDEATCGSPFHLDPDEYPFLTKLGRNLSVLAERDLFDPVIGRDNEIQQVVDILNKRRSNNPCLVGDPGVGKTAIVEGVVSSLVQLEGKADKASRIFVQIDVGAILAGTHLRGSLAERLRGLQDEVKAANGRVVIFIDEIHSLIGAGGGDGAHDAANELKAALAKGEFPCIGATTIGEYREYIDSDAALERRFTSINVAEPTIKDTIRIVSAVADRYALHHDVEYGQESLEAAVRLGRRYMHERKDPDRALGILDLAGAVARRSGGFVDRRAVAEVIARIAQVPLEHLLVDDPERFLTMEKILGEEIIGQDHVLKATSETIRRNLAGFASKQPIGSFLFLGPTGVGKTEAVKALASFLFGSPDAMVRFDMSEFLESHSVARLIGSPPGYVGHQEGGQLTDRIRRRPYQVVLFDEIEKSHRDVWNILLQILDEGHLSDARGRTIDFSNTLVVMTSNIGAESFKIDERKIGFGTAGAPDIDRMTKRACDKAKATFPPELWNRIEAKLVFHPLTVDEIHRIANLQVQHRSTVLQDERGITFSATNLAIQYLVEHGGYDPELGARPMRQAIARDFETPMARQILAQRVLRDDHILIDCPREELTFEVQRPRESGDRISGSFLAADESWSEPESAQV